MARQNELKGPIRLLSMAVLAFSVGGCVSPDRLAERMVAAPNLQDNGLKFHLGKIKVLNSALSSYRVPVSRPEAEISVTIFPPGAFPRAKMTVQPKLETHRLKLEVTFAALEAVLMQPADNAAERGVIFLLHGYSLNKEVMFPWAFILSKAGYRCVLVDLRGHGESTGETVSFGKYETEDLVQVLDFLEAKGLCRGPVGALGISLGADLALHWMSRDSRVQTAVAIAPFDDPVLTAKRVTRLLRLPVTQRSVLKGVERAAQKLGVNWSDWTGSMAAGRVQKPTLFIAAGNDPISPAEEVAHLKELAPGGSELITVPEANHDVIGFWVHELGEPVNDWFGKHLATPGPGKLTATPGEAAPAGP